MASRFKLQLLPEDPANIEFSREKIRQEIKDYETAYYSSHPESVGDRKVGLLFQDLYQGGYWRILNAVDGYSRISSCIPFFERKSPLEYRQERQRARIWGRRTFGDEGLGKLLNLAVNEAFLAPYGTEGWPGLTRPHSILYEDLVEKDDSIFSGVIGPELKRRLNNGRFWEELPDMWPWLNAGSSFRIAGDVLEATPALDVNFAPRGFEIFHSRRVMGKKDPKTPAFKLGLLSNKTIDFYLSFVKRIQVSKEELGISENDIAYLVAPYVVELMNVTEQDIPRFNSPGSPDFRERLRDPMISHYLNTSEHVRSVLMHKLEMDLSYGSRESPVTDILSCVEDRLTFVSQMIFRAEDTYNVNRMVGKLKRKGIDLVIPELAPRH